MQELYKFLIFETFISHGMLFIFYYLGAIFLPFIGFIYAKKLYQYPKDSLNKMLPNSYKVKLIALSVMFFLFMEILWRMMFEYLFAFLQMRDALLLSQ
ncbi:DUF4282 domain-containing protein [Sulfurimonas sp. SAG-AH-194-I05]|nr:DUF4282 domain-containing protein [Sulfurimonas sp. SAG-AH-194-I05]MDF1874325.1 DUF4282 domain-containing protein [Sulfurimonas sp. SAG-AH-194-I05]